MIVKKVGTSKTAAPKSKASNVRALIDYIAGVAAGGDGEKVEHRGAVNLLNIDHDGQVQEMIDLAEVARRSPQPVQHWILSWREGEQPTRAQADEAVGMFLAEMGLGEHQAVYALHRDTHNCHVHVAINRVHPTTEKVVTVNNGFDLESPTGRSPASSSGRGGNAKRAVSMPWTRMVAPNGSGLGIRANVDRPVEPRTWRSEPANAAPSGSRSRRPRRSSGRREAGAKLHAALAAQGMRYEKKGSGALLWIGEQPVKASAVGRDCSMAALRKRLGEFEPAPSTPVRVPAPSRAIDPAAPTLRVYLDARRKHYEDREARRARATGEQRRKWRDMVDRHRNERADISRRLMAGQARPLERDAKRARGSPGPGEGRGSRAPATGAGSAPSRASVHSLPMKTGWHAGTATRPTDGGTASGGPPRSRARRSSNLPSATFAPSPPSSTAGGSTTTSHDHVVPRSPTTGRRSISTTVGPARASSPPCN